MPGFLFEEPGIFFAERHGFGRLFKGVTPGLYLDLQFPDKFECFLFPQLSHDLPLLISQLAGLGGVIALQNQFAIVVADKTDIGSEPFGHSLQDVLLCLVVQSCACHQVPQVPGLVAVISRQGK